MIWLLILSCGLLTYFLRALPLVLLKKEMLNEDLKIVLSYVPSAIFPAIIFPAVFLDKNFSFVVFNNPQIIAALFAVISAYLFKNIIVTIITGMISYWMLIFVIM